MSYETEAIGFAARNLKKVRDLIQNTAQRQVEAERLGVDAAAMLTMLQAEETRIAALT